MLAEWDREAAKPALRKIIQHCPLRFADGDGGLSSGCSVAPKQFAALAVAMAELGDTTGLDLYAKWIYNKKLDDLKDALPEALSPFGHFPDHPAIREASARLFQTEKGDWMSEQVGHDPLKTRLPLNQAFRALILHALADKTKAGAIVLKENNGFEVRKANISGGGVLKPDALAPKVGETVSIRVCDDVAHRLSRIEDLPSIKLYWPEAKRDEALAGIVGFLADRRETLKLKPAPWLSAD